MLKCKTPYVTYKYIKMLFAFIDKAYFKIRSEFWLIYSDWPSAVTRGGSVLHYRLYSSSLSRSLVRTFTPSISPSTGKLFFSLSEDGVGSWPYCYYVLQYPTNTLEFDFFLFFGNCTTAWYLMRKCKSDVRENIWDCNAAHRDTHLEKWRLRLWVRWAALLVGSRR